MAQKFIGETSGKYWKQKNDETYVNEEELVKITDLEESTTVDDNELLIKGNPSAGTMLKIKVANFLDGIKEKLLGSTDISSIGDGTVTGAINTNAETIAANKEDADGKYTELNSALAEMDTITTGSFSYNSTYCSLTTSAYRKMGRFVLVTIAGTMNFSAIGTENTFVAFASGVPTPEVNQYFDFPVMNNSSAGLVWRITTDGEILVNNSGAKLATTGSWFGGSALYIAK